MNDNSSNDFSVAELKLIHDTLADRYGKSIDTERAGIVFYNANTHSF